MDTKLSTKSLVALSATVLISACGGGSGSVGAGSGGGSGSTSPTTLKTAPGAAAITSYLQTSHQSTLIATDTTGNSYVMQLSNTPKAGTTTFDGNSGASSSADKVALSKNGVGVDSSSSETYYTLNPYRHLGDVYGAGTPYAVASNSTDIPTTVSVDDSGTVDDVTLYHDSSQTVVDADATQTYSVSAHDAKTVLLCIKTDTTDVTAAGTADGLSVGAESDCYTVDAAGNATLNSVAKSVSGESLDFK